MSDINEVIQTIAVYLIPVLFAISLHEASHGYAARYFGDPTASHEGRLSLNPMRHIDPFGTVLLPLLLYFTIQVPFGYAKPVPVDFSRLRNPKKQMAWVAFAGPAANFAMGLGWMIFLVLLYSVHVEESFFLKMAAAGVSVNAAMFVFNLIPVPPLDGGRILTGLLPMDLARKYARIEMYGIYVFGALVLLMYSGVLSGLLRGAIGFVIGVFQTLVYPLASLLS
ncbi:site-2 protease family protein [Janthinobacterium agaricidamnosum]|uniref:Peptidase M50 family protein n=1 Tax=Janthinobacterium agaricidamnosum NBRC 102515 = DSM 9628 TaxID=1349767 RepID=W0UZL7_9BURK|nr:site-2 protease family protein [Janthinobacterium agaricidamnosum]CDG82014.1 peptidase M50 family protein [Janthinobacterium agaricidamnosum NBRC 102515 = DSM 9628]